MFFSYGPKYTSDIYNWGNTKDRHDNHTYHIPTKTNCLGILFHISYRV